MIDALFFITAFFSEVAGTVAGFGSSTLFLPLALFFVDFKTALVLVALFHIFGNFGRIAFFKQVDGKLLLLFGIPSVVLTVIGALLVSVAPQEFLKLALGVFLVLFSLSSFIRPGSRLNASKENAVLGGGLSGFLAGLIGTGGAIRSAFLTAFGLEKERYVATAAAIALAVDLTRIPIYFGSGFLPAQSYAYVPVLFAVALAGSFVGKRIVDAIPQDAFKKVVFVALGLVGLKFILDGIAFLA